MLYLNFVLISYKAAFENHFTRNDIHVYFNQF